MSADDKKNQGRAARRAVDRVRSRSRSRRPSAWLVLIALAVFLFRAFQDVGVRRIPYSQFKEMLRRGASSGSSSGRTGSAASRRPAARRERPDGERRGSGAALRREPRARAATTSSSPTIERARRSLRRRLRRRHGRPLLDLDRADRASGSCSGLGDAADVRADGPGAAGRDGVRQDARAHPHGARHRRDLRGRRRHRRGGRGAAGDRRVPEDAGEVPPPRRPHPEGRAARRASRAPARRCSRAPPRARRACRSSRSPAPSSWRCSSASARPACATSSRRRRQKAPCIVFIDELDALGKRRNSGHGRRPRRARADAEPAPRRDGRLRRARRAHHHGRDEPARRSSTPRSCAPAASTGRCSSIAPTSAAARRSCRSTRRT